MIDTDDIASVGDSVRKSADPGEGLRAAAALRRLAEDLEMLHVDKARRLGWSWREIAEALGVTKQTVHRKHRRR